MEDILLIGGGGHCKAVIDVLQRNGAWRIAGIVEQPQSGNSSVLGYPVVGSDADLPGLRKRCRFALVTVGQIKTPRIRMALYARLAECGFTLPVIVSPLASVSDSAELGAGTVVMHFACIGPDARVGENTIVNTRALLEHDSQAGSHCHISTAAILNGGAKVGDGTFIGSGSIVREGVAIGASCVVGMGASVTRNLPDGAFLKGRAS